jgi:deoxyribodipyrimidine photolyase-like uncharacterized protein
VTSVWILGDQLLEAHPAMAHARAGSERVEVIMVESARRLRRLPYHKKKLVLLLSALRPLRPRPAQAPEACPFNTLYWNFLLTHERRLRANPRLGPAVLGLRRLGAAERRAVRASAQGLLARLDRA